MPARTRRDRLRLWVLLTPIAVAIVAGNIGAWFGPTIVVHHPLLEVILNPGNRYLALAATLVSAASFFVVGFMRLVMMDPVWYLLGRWYGDEALAWARDRSPATARRIALLERWFARWRDAFVFIAPNAIVSLLAGATRMPVVRFAALNAAGTLARLALIWWLADIFSGPLGAISRFIDRYQWWLVGLSVAIGVAQLSRRRARRPADPEPDPADAGQ